jgi:hypothetical protein
LPKAHRNTDKRACGALTTVIGQNFCYVNDLWWAVEGDTNTHGAGGLIPTYHGVYINNKPVIVHTPDVAQFDNAGHGLNEDETDQGSDGVYDYEE